MANPNKTVAEWRRKNPRNRSAEISDRERKANPEMFAIMDAVSEGRMTAADGAQRIKEMTERNEA